MRIAGNISRMNELENNNFSPVISAKQTTEVLCNDGRVRMQIKKVPYQAQEIIEGRI
jgi:hypothetical protein